MNATIEEVLRGRVMPLEARLVTGYRCTVLAGGLQRACKAVRLPAPGARCALPCLWTVLVSVSGGAGDGVLRLTATDLSDWVQSDPIPARSEGLPFSVCVPAKTLRDWVSIEEAGAQLHIDYEPGIEMLYITAGNARAEFKCINAAEFPPMPAAPVHKVKRPSFAALCKQALKQGYTQALDSAGNTTPLLVLLHRPAHKMPEDYWAREDIDGEARLALMVHNRPGGYRQDPESGEWVPETENQDPDGWHRGGYYILMNAPVSIDEVTQPEPEAQESEGES